MSWLYTCVSRMYLQFVCLGLLWTWQDVIVLTGCWFWSFCSINSHCVKTKSKFNDSNYYLRLSVIPSLSFATFRVERATCWSAQMNYIIWSAALMLDLESYFVDICWHSVLDGSRGHTKLRWVQWEGQIWLLIVNHMALWTHFLYCK